MEMGKTAVPALRRAVYRNEAISASSVRIVSSTSSGLYVDENVSFSDSLNKTFTHRLRSCGMVKVHRSVSPVVFLWFTGKPSAEMDVSCTISLCWRRLQHV